MAMEQVEVGLPWGGWKLRAVPRKGEFYDPQLTFISFSGVGGVMEPPKPGEPSPGAICPSLFVQLRTSLTPYPVSVVFSNANGLEAGACPDIASYQGEV